MSHDQVQPYVHQPGVYQAGLAIPGEISSAQHQITTQEQARAAGEAALMAPSTYRTEWDSGTGRETTNFSVTEPGATFSATFLGPDLDNNATCLVVQTETRREGGSVERAAYATDFSTLIALPIYDPQTGSFGSVGDKVQAWRAGRHPVPVDKDLVVGQPLFGKPGEAVVRAVVMPEAAMAQPTMVFDRVRYDSDDGVVLWHSDRSAPDYTGPRYVSGPVGGREMPLRKRPDPNPVKSAYGHLIRVKEHYEKLEAAITRGAGQAAANGS